MRDKGKQMALAGAFSSALLIAAGTTAVGADTRLVEAVRKHDQQQVRALLNQHADVHARSGDGSTALHFAAREGDIESVRLLLAAGVSINIRSQPDRPQTAAGTEQPLAGTRALSATASDGATPLLVATLRAQVPLALFLLEQGAD